MNERNFCIEDPAGCFIDLSGAIGPEGWLNLIWFVGKAGLFMLGVM